MLEFGDLIRSRSSSFRQIRTTCRHRKKSISGTIHKLRDQKTKNRHITQAHCAFSSILFHGHIVQKGINQMSPPENKKCSPGKVFGIKTALKPCYF